MVPPHQPRSLKLTLRLDGEPESVRRLPLTERVTLGPRPTDTFSVPSLSESHTLITSEATGHHLLLSAALEGTLWRGDGSRELGTLWRPEGRLPLTLSDRLELRIQGATLAVTFASEAPEALPLPGRFRPRLLEPDSGPLLASLSLFSTLIGALVLFALGTTIPDRVKLTDIPDRFVTIPMDATPPAPDEDEGDQPPPELDAVADAMEPTGGENGRLFGEAPRNLDQRLRELIADQPDPGGLADPDLPNEIIALLQQTRLEHFDDYVDLTQEEGPRGSSSRIGDLTVEIDRAEVGEVLVAAAPVTRPEPEQWLPEPIQRAPRRGAPSAAIRDQVRDYQRQIRSCYERRLRENPTLSGRLEVEMDILSGQVVMAQINNDTTGDDALGQCIVLRARSWRFPTEIDEKIVLPFALY
ncbi:MAG: hypothetical protein ACI8RZ_002886 [Myxococcota bacterium]|jgi:hypothetical protein